MDIFACHKCGKQFTEDDLNEKPEYHDDDEDEHGNHLWQVHLTCPHCGYDFWEEFWE